MTDQGWQVDDGEPDLDDWWGDPDEYDGSQPDPDDYDEPCCHRCWDSGAVTVWFHRERRCPSCNPGPIRLWWWSHITRHWVGWRWRRKYGPRNFDTEAPF